MGPVLVRGEFQWLWHATFFRGFLSLALELNRVRSPLRATDLQVAVHQALQFDGESLLRCYEMMRYR